MLRGSGRQSSDIQARKARVDMDMCSGPVLPKLLRFTLPLMLSSILQLLYNTVGVIVVSRFEGSTALAAVGSTGALNNLLIALMLGLSVGASVVTAQCYGARDERGVSESVHTAMLLSLVGGILVGAGGFIACRPLLHLMGSPDDVIDQTTLYLRIIFIGLPVQMIFNFGSAILRAVGDTKRPLYYLSFAGLINVVLNLIFVIVFRMGVAGVAWATIISQTISAVLVVLCLMRSDGCFKLYLRQLRITRDKMIQIIKIGLPAGAQSIVFSISNILIQSSVNSFGSIAMAGNAASANIEGYAYSAQNSFYQGAMTFVGQNVGAKRYDRIARITRTCALTVTVVGLSLGLITYSFGPQLLGIYDTDPNVISYGMIRLTVFGFTYFICGLMEVYCGSLRGMGCGIMPMTVSLLGSCVLRVIWIYTIFQLERTLLVLYLSYPITWIITALAHYCCYRVILKRLLKKLPSAEQKE
jgi:putative MATE family efflux protein